MNAQPHIGGLNAFNGSSNNFSDMSSIIRQSAEMHQPPVQQPSMPVQQGGKGCPICRREFTKESGLKRHMRVHNQPATPIPIRLMPFTCKFCNIPFNSGPDLDRHLEVQHSVYGTHVQKCTQCGCFRPVNAMCVLNPFRCDNCSGGQHQTNNGFPNHVGGSINIPNHTGGERASFPVASSFDARRSTPASNSKPIIHSTSTKPDKAHKCPQCPKSFGHANSLSIHKKSHTGEYKDICEYCDKTFYLHDYYIRHLRVHTKEKPYTCDVCSKSFSQSNTLTQHKRIHTGEKPYSCEECGKSFGVRDYLNKHRRVHTGEKPYECDVCTKRYSQASALRSHKRQLSH